MRNACNITIRKSDGRASFGRPGCRWENIKMDLKATGCESVDWSHVTGDMAEWQALKRRGIY
jgi:hypothetical protein